jgi:hypothetical protein
MGMSVIRFLALFFAALAFAPAAAHLLELPNKIGLPRDEYFTVQQIYRGWALLGIVVFGALLSTLVHAVKVRKQHRIFRYALIAFLCIVGTQVVFWTFTFPTNQQTVNWTTIPPDWESLRTQWEYSHAASAVLNLAALLALITCAVLPQRETVSSTGFEPANRRQ